jgi:hypothetical protein
MADNTIIQQGSFTSTGAPVTLNLRSGVDWIKTINFTQSAGTTQWKSVEHAWYSGMAQNDSVLKDHGAASSVLNSGNSSTAINGATHSGFTIWNGNNAANYPFYAVTAGTNATQPVFSTGNTGVLTTGSIVRLTGSAQTDINGMDFTVDTVTANTSFRMEAPLQQAPGVVAGAAGFYQMIAPSLSVYQKFYPSRRTIVNISNANPGVVTTSVDHGLVTGQQVRLNIPDLAGMTELNGTGGIYPTYTVTVINAYQFSIGVDTTAYTAFYFALPGDVPFTPAEMIPVGNYPSSTGSLTDATIDQSFSGVTLAGGALCPAGENAEVIYWIAGKSFNI